MTLFPKKENIVSTSNAAGFAFFFVLFISFFIYFWRKSWYSNHATNSNKKQQN